MENIPAYFYLLLLIVSFIYASVGHGGASGYLALMALFSFTPAVMKPVALLLNLLVSSLAFIQFYRAGHFKFKLLWPFAITSIPLAFVGGMIQLSDAWYKQLLGVLLLIPVARFFFFKTYEKPERQINLFMALITGAIIGLLSGMIGIGGGILLSPIILMLGYANQREAAAVSASFIFVNSLAGLAGQALSGFELTGNIYWMLTVAAVGGIAGAFTGARKFSHRGIQLTLAIVLLVASLKLLFVK